MKKTCACCGKVHQSIPADAKFAMDAVLPGWYFNCQCGSTLVVPYGDKLKKSLEDFRAVQASGMASKKAS